MFCYSVYLNLEGLSTADKQHINSRACASRSHHVLEMESSSRIEFGSSHLREKDLQEEFGQGLFLV